MARTETRHLIEIVFLPDSLNLPFFLPVSIVLVPVWLVSFAIVALAVLRAFVVWPLERGPSWCWKWTFAFLVPWLF